MSYKVINYFTDLQDFNHPYQVGDEFPRQGMTVSKARLEELSSNKNKQGRPLIALIKEEVKEVEEVKEEIIYTKTMINRMSITDLKALAKEKGIDNETEKSGAELKKELINLMDL